MSPNFSKKKAIKIPKIISKTGTKNGAKKVREKMESLNKLIEDDISVTNMKVQTLLSHNTSQISKTETAMQDADCCYRET